MLSYREFDQALSRAMQQWRTQHGLLLDTPPEEFSTAVSDDYNQAVGETAERLLAGYSNAQLLEMLADAPSLLDRRLDAVDDESLGDAIRRAMIDGVCELQVAPG